MNKKLPACDACKTRRVLCHSQPSNIACPRCAEKGIICKTTPVRRGRPRRNHNGISEASTSSNATSDVALRQHIELSGIPQLPAELVKDLFECCVYVAECRMPLFRYEKLKATLAAASWQLHLLPPQSRVLATCVCAISASISFNSTVIGPGPQPKSFMDRSVFFPGSDLRIYGVRRATFCRRTYEQALNLACENRIHLDVSEDNAASCFFLDFLERFNDTITRSWAVTYVSHARILLGSVHEVTLPRGFALWMGFMMSEALTAAMQRKPVLITHLDQLLANGSESPPLEEFLQSLQAMRQTPKNSADLVFSSVRHYMFHVTRLARDLQENIAGDYARRRPFALGAVMKFLSSLSILQSILTLVLDQLELCPDAELLFLDHQKPSSYHEENSLRACGFAVTAGFAGLVLALRSEIKYRTTTEAHTVDDRWLQERTDVLRRQVHELASFTVGMVVRAMRLLPSLPHLAHLGWIGVQDWAEFCLTEPTGAVDPEVFKTLIAALKLSGYSWNMPRSSELIEQMEACLAQHNPTTQSDFSEIFNEMSPDIIWNGMFATNQSEMAFYDSTDL
ncbi:hypothetical protein C8F04DRAFT_1071477 [Mycena alexandri]|uniref:Zn(2)-C6 fungal-type domain-containing protein n=1 Tax=Mycena alexandri TaxID=1745969 RepID=A0AAD6XG71_9AGAR|nr:hypothetical protein C8F04DRAFT_1071477 [Mycena alexandri]